MAETQRGEVDFEIKDYEDGAHWILINIKQQDFPELRGGFAGLDIKPGTLYEEIQELVTKLRTHITSFSITNF